ncbi:MAG: hypothetical protein QOJ70_1028 [Acidobacteriota bacterium]|jgi:hypothetical protein|nr:hypothetical protein [Acidobacteriota bacterium]
MLDDDARSAFEELYAAKDVAAMNGVKPHLLPLFFGEPRGLAKYRVGHSDLADVVKERAELKRAHLLLAQSQLATQTQAERDDALRVSVRLRVACFERRDERLECHAVGALQRAERAVQLARALLDRAFEIVLVAAPCCEQALVFQRAMDDETDVLKVERLEYVVERPGAHGSHGALYVLRTAHHDDERTGRKLVHARNHLQTRHALHGDVAEDELKLVRTEQRERLLGRPHGAALICETEEIFKHAPHARIVVHDKQASAARGLRREARRLRRRYRTVGWQRH